MDFKTAKRHFEEYLNDYDRTDDKVKLKITHTYGVVKQASDIAKRMQLNQEDTDLAMLIALLHDIGRFEQLKRFDSFEPGTFDHAAYGAEILFQEGMIRRFTEETAWDDIIHTAIALHSEYALPDIPDERTLLHARLIRDADKLDNCRVKLADRLETFMGATGEDIGRQEISPHILQCIFQNRCIRSEDRITKMDYWLSYIAYFFDIYFKESIAIILEQDYLTRIIRRIPYNNPETAALMEQVESHMQDYLHAAADGTVTLPQNGTK